MHISERLQKIIDWVPMSVTVADIGTDHGFVPISLIRTGKAKRAIASDINEGPLSLAREHIENFGLTEQIELRIGDGLTVLTPGEADTILLTGIGGALMNRILEEGLSVAKSAKTLILSPQSEIPLVRHFLSDSGFEMDDETMLFSDGKYYTILRCHFTGNTYELTETEYEFGPVLIRNLSLDFLSYLQKEENSLTEIIEKISDIKGQESTLFVKEKRRDMIREILKGNDGELPGK